MGPSRWLLHRSVLKYVYQVHHIVQVLDHEVDCIVFHDEGHTFPCVEHLLVVTQLHGFKPSEYLRFAELDLAAPYLFFFHSLFFLSFT